MDSDGFRWKIMHRRLSWKCKEITVPNELNGVKVWLIDSDAFMDNMDVEKVVVSYGIQIVRRSGLLKDVII